MCKSRCVLEIVQGGGVGCCLLLSSEIGAEPQGRCKAGVAAGRYGVGKRGKLGSADPADLGGLIVRHELFLGGSDWAWSRWSGVGSRRGVGGQKAGGIEKRILAGGMWEGQGTM